MVVGPSFLTDPLGQLPIRWAKFIVLPHVLVIVCPTFGFVCATKARQAYSQHTIWLVELVNLYLSPILTVPNGCVLRKRQVQRLE